MSFVLLGILNSQAAGGGALADSFDHISTTTLSGATQTVSFTGLNTLTDYKHLQFRLSVNSDYTGGASAWRINMRMNSDTTGSYSWKNVHNVGTASYSLQSYGTSDSRLRIGDILLNPTTYGDHYGGVTIDLLDFSSTSKYKSFYARAGVADSINQFTRTDWGMWMKTTAISSISFYPADTNFGIESNFALYGWKG